MGADTKIQWTTHTFNPWRGCTRVSPGCTNCYAETLSHRNPKVLGIWGPQGTRVVASESYWRQPLRWDRLAECSGIRHRVFCASLADVFEDRPELDAPRLRLWRLILATPHLDWLLLTKRPEVAARWLEDNVYGPAEYGDWTMTGDGGGVVPNVWIGVSCEDQRRADERIPALNEIPARVRFVSFEPLLGPIETQPDPPNLYGCIHWAIVGGESGHGARPCDLAWVRSIRDQCRAAGVPVFVKQLGTRPYYLDGCSGPGLVWPALVLDDPKGGDIDEWPADLRIREFPGGGS